jgi:hypothetical protein
MPPTSRQKWAKLRKLLVIYMQEKNRSQRAGAGDVSKEKN